MIEQDGDNSLQWATRVDPTQRNFVARRRPTNSQEVLYRYLEANVIPNNNAADTVEFRISEDWPLKSIRGKFQEPEIVAMQTGDAVGHKVTLRGNDAFLYRTELAMIHGRLRAFFNQYGGTDSPSTPTLK